MAAGVAAQVVVLVAQSLEVLVVGTVEEAVEVEVHVMGTLQVQVALGSEAS